MTEVKVGDTIEVLESELPYFKVGNQGIVVSINTSFIEVDFTKNTSYYKRGSWSVGNGMYKVIENYTNNVSDGSTASYYELPPNATELQDLISHKNLNAQIGEIFRECYRYGQASHCDELRGAKKIKFYIDAEIKRLELDKLNNTP